MKKIEAKTLEEAYALATEAFGCSITALECEIIQYPSSGFLGLFAKKAIIVVAPQTSSPEPTEVSEPPTEKHQEEKPQERDTEVQEKKHTIESASLEEDATERVVLESFFEEKGEEREEDAVDEHTILQEEIEAKLKALVTGSCFDIDVVEVDVIENTAYVFIDGEDAALLIGKEGYRYNALSYLISNWLQNSYSLYLKLEIAQFLASQQEMIRSYMEPVIEHVEQEGWGRTRALDGVLVQIALEQLREEFPNKYVAIKRTRNGDRYVLINEFNKR